MINNKISEILNNPAIQQGYGEIIFPLLTHYNQLMGGVHLPTIVGAVAALLGERVLMAMHPQLLNADPQYIRSENVEDFMFRGVICSPSIAEIIMQFGALPDGIRNTETFYNDIVKRSTAGFGGTLPALSVPPDYYPDEWSPNAINAFRSRVDFVSANLDIKGINVAYMLAVGLCDVLNMSDKFSNGLESRKELTRLALEIAYGCACMVPLRNESVRAA